MENDPHGLCLGAAVLMALHGRRWAAGSMGCRIHGAAGQREADGARRGEGEGFRDCEAQ